MLVLLIAATVLGAGLAVPALARSADVRRAAAAERELQVRERTERERQAQVEAEAARQAEAEAGRRRELADIAADPARHLWRMMLAASRQRMQGRRHAVAQAQRNIRWAHEDAAVAADGLASYESTHPWVGKERNRHVVEAFNRSAPAVIALALLLDYMITSVVLGGVVGMVFAPFAVVVIGAGSVAGTWALGLPEGTANVLRSTGRMLVLAASVMMVLGMTWALLLWAPARSGHLYGPRIQQATMAWQQAQQAGKPQVVVDSAQLAVTDLTAEMKRSQKVDQVLVGLQVLLEGGVIEAMLMGRVVRRRRELHDAVEQGPARVRQAEVALEEATAQADQDSTLVAERMAQTLTEIGTPWQDMRVQILTAFEGRKDLDVYQAAALAASTAAASDVPERDPETDPATGPAADPATGPAADPGTVRGVTDVPMPDHPRPVPYDLDALDEAG